MKSVMFSESVICGGWGCRAIILKTAVIHHEGTKNTKESFSYSKKRISQKMPSFFKVLST